MNTASAFALGEANQGRELKVFDWDKAATIIRERKPEEAIAGLAGDMEWTGGIIYEDGKPVLDDYTFLASTWATPVLVIDHEEISCYKMQSQTDNWDAETKWPASSLAILNREETSAVEEAKPNFLSPSFSL